VAGQFRFSAQTLAVLATLEADPACWLHGYPIAKQTGLGPGTLQRLAAGRRRLAAEGGA
jgi:hypothetical protein